ncbi:hypothetical protein O181_048472 [Austropuccinia psidii MF-1]|uniref:Uncharacterized protein n=1 Tax=Austropuccinia psidii MF-1 TaxID=1389203 RepID=A0A9Q3DZY4_9BASI|nr:hypothetical protein [Austropuccinia psidii MF-1]
MTPTISGITTPYNQMALDQDIQVINPNYKIVSPEERHKWNIPELPPVPKGVGTSAKSLDRHNELISSSEEVHGPTEYREYFAQLDTHVLQRTSPIDKSLLENPKHVVRGPEEEVGPRKGQNIHGSSPSLNRCQTRAIKPQRAIRRARKRQRERPSPSRSKITHRTTELLRKRRKPWTMWLIWTGL